MVKKYITQVSKAFEEKVNNAFAAGTTIFMLSFLIWVIISF
jgi:hypothetical protein